MAELSNTTPEKICSVPGCGKPVTSRCSGCKTAEYCGGECQNECLFTLSCCWGGGTAAFHVVVVVVVVVIVGERFVEIPQELVDTGVDKHK